MQKDCPFGEHASGNISGLRDTSYGFAKRLKFVWSQVENYRKVHVGEEIEILDIGCGTGQLLTGPLSDLCKYAKITGIDIHKNSIEAANDVFSDKKNISFEYKSLEECDDGFYDVTICSEVLEHITGYRDFMAKLVQKTRPGGIVILTVPNGVGPFEVQSWLWHRYFENSKLYWFAKRIRGRSTEKNRQIAFLNRESRHVNFFRHRQLIDFFSQSGLEILKYEGRTFVAGPFVEMFMRLSWMSKLNSWLGSVLPYWAVSGWMFALIRK